MSNAVVDPNPGRGSISRHRREAGCDRRTEPRRGPRRATTSAVAPSLGSRPTNSGVRSLRSARTSTSSPASRLASAVGPVSWATTGIQGPTVNTRIVGGPYVDADVELLAERLDQARRDGHRVVDRRLRTVDLGEHDVADPGRREQARRPAASSRRRCDRAHRSRSRRRRSSGARPPVGEVERAVVDHGEGDPVAVLPSGNGQHPRIAEVQHAVVALGRIERELGAEQRRERRSRGVPRAVADPT